MGTIKRSDFSAKLPWRRLLSPDVVRNDDGSLMRTFQLYGPDLSGTSEEVRGARMLQANNAVRRLGAGWVLQVEARRWEVTHAMMPPSTFQHSLMQRIYQETCEEIFQPGKHFHSDYFLTLSYQPPAPVVSWLEDQFSVGESPLATETLDEHLVTFRAQTAHLGHLLGGDRALIPLNAKDTCSYLHSCISSKRHPVRVPDYPDALHYQLVDDDFHGGWDLTLGPLWLRIVSIVDLPDASIAGLLDGLNDLGIEYRWCARYIALPKPKARRIMRSLQGQLFGSRVGMFSRAIGQFFGQASQIEDQDSRNKSDAVGDARAESGADLTGFGYFSDAIVVWDRDARQAYAKARAVEELINDRECVAVLESTRLEDTFFGTMPGNVTDNLVRLMESSLNRVHTMPGLMQVWHGISWDTHLNAPALLHVTTGHSSLLHISTHAPGHDVGDFLVLGDRGAGKTVLLGTLLLCWTQYVGSRGIVMDMKGGLRAPVLCLGGTHIDLGRSGPLFQPLRDLETRQDRERAEHWLFHLMELRHVPLTTGTQAYVRVGLDALSRQPVSRRRLCDLMDAWRDQSRRPRNPHRESAESYESTSNLHLAARTALEPLIGGLLDGTDNAPFEASVLAFEWEELLGKPELIDIYMSYLWPALEGTFTGMPTLFLMDEFGRLTASPFVADMLDKGVRTYRFKNVVFGLATQYPEDITETKLGQMLQRAPNLFCLPHPAAQSESFRRAYESLEVTPRERYQLSVRPQKWQYFWSSPVGRGFFEMRLKGTALHVCGRATPAHQRRMTEILEAYGLEHFWEGWLDAMAREDAQDRQLGELSDAVDAELAYALR